MEEQKSEEHTWMEMTHIFKLGRLGAAIARSLGELLKLVTFYTGSKFQ